MSDHFRNVRNSMNKHFTETRNMVSDTPRMKAAQNAAMKHMTGDVWRVGCDLERELKAANDRIKRLEEAGDGLLTSMRDDWSEYVDWIDETTDSIGKWRRAKEAKP